MEFNINESGCMGLIEDMTADMEQLGRLISEIDSQNQNLRAALGDDYDSIAKNIKVMRERLKDTYQQMKIIITDMTEYMEKVKQARIVLG